MRPRPGEPVILVDDHRRQAFVAVPKAGSTSVLLAWERLLGLDPSPVHWRRWPRCESRAWLAAHPEYHRWAVIRHPCDRLVSLWLDKIDRPGLARRADLIANPQLAAGIGLPLDAFVRFIARYIPLNRPETDRHLQTQRWHLAHRGRLAVDKVFRLNRLSEAWPSLQARFGFAELPRENVQPDRGSWQDYMDYKTESLVRKLYAEDFTLWETAPCPASAP
jgi:hypothetical protein